MVELNYALKVIFAISALAFLLTFAVVPHSHCDTCELEYEGELIDGYKAFNIFEEGCVSYSKPWDATTDNIINVDLLVNQSEEGNQS